MSEWKDATSYSRGERGIKSPNTWRLDAEGMNITVSCGHKFAPDEWIVHCRDVGFDTYPIGLPATVSADLAQRAAVNLVLKEARDRLKRIEKIARMAIRNAAH